MLWRLHDAARMDEHRRLPRAVLALLLFVAPLLLPGGTGCFSDCDLKITTNSVPDAVVGVEYRFNLDSKCGGDDWFINDGSLPPGIQLQSDGDFRGVPTVVGVFVFTVGVVDYNRGDAAFQGFQIVVRSSVAPTPTATQGAAAP